MKKRKSISIVLLVILCVVLGIMAMVSRPVSAKNDKAEGKAKVNKGSVKKDKKDDKSRYDASAKGLVYAADVLSVKGPGFKVKRVSSPHWMRGRENMPNYVSDVLETDKNSVACVEFLNGSQLGINKGTKVEIISTSGATDITQRGTVEKVILKSGTIWAKVTGQKKKTFNVETSKGVLGVKGTEFVVESDPAADQEKVTVLEGEVEFDPTSGEARSITPGEEVTYSKGMKATVVKKSIDDLRSALNGRLPGLNPREQAIISVFTSRLGIRGLGNARHALSVASQTMSLVDNPEEAIKSRALSEARSHSPIGIPSGVFGNRKPKREKPKKIANLAPNGKTIDTYYPEFTWDKNEKAEAYRFFVTREPLKKGVDNPGYYAFAQVKENKIKYDYSFRSLKPGFTYYWSVVPVNKEGKPIAPSSDPAIFTMAGYEKLGVKGLYPTGSVEKPSGDLVFDWTPVAGVTKYKVEVSLNEDMSAPVITKETDVNYMVLKDPASVLPGKKGYYWKVTPSESQEGTPAVGGSTCMFCFVDGDK